MRESDGDHFLWNGEGCVRVSCINNYSEYAEERKWHHDYNELPVDEVNLLNDTMNSRARGFTILGRGRYQVVTRGEFVS